MSTPGGGQPKGGRGGGRGGRGSRGGQGHHPNEPHTHAPQPAQHGPVDHYPNVSIPPRTQSAPPSIEQPPHVMMPHPSPQGPQMPPQAQSPVTPGQQQPPQPRFAADGKQGPRPLPPTQASPQLQAQGGVIIPGGAIPLQAAHMGSPAAAAVMPAMAPGAAPLPPAAMAHMDMGGHMRPYIPYMYPGFHPAMHGMQFIQQLPPGYQYQPRPGMMPQPMGGIPVGQRPQMAMGPGGQLGQPGQNAPAQPTQPQAAPQPIVKPKSSAIRITDPTTGQDVSVQALAAKPTPAAPPAGAPPTPVSTVTTPVAPATPAGPAAAVAAEERAATESPKPVRTPVVMTAPPGRSTPVKIEAPPGRTEAQATPSKVEAAPRPSTPASAGATVATATPSTPTEPSKPEASAPADAAPKAAPQSESKPEPPQDKPKETPAPSVARALEAPAETQRPASPAPSKPSPSPVPAPATPVVPAEESMPASETATPARAMSPTAETPASVDAATPADVSDADVSGTTTPRFPADEEGATPGRLGLSKSLPGSTTDLTYPDGTWSPSNQSGKRLYQRNFLLKFSEVSKHFKVPENMPNLQQIIQTDDATGKGGAGGPPPSPGGQMNRSQSGRAPAGGQRGSQGQGGFPQQGGLYRQPSQGSTGMGQFPMQRSSSAGPMQPGMRPGVQGDRRASGGRQQQQHGGQRGQRGGRGPPEPIHLDHVEPLKQTENRWKIFDPNQLAEEEKENEVLFRKVQSILNKLTLEKFESLFQQMVNLQIKTDAQLVGVIDRIYRKALDEPSFSMMYAQLCKRLALAVQLHRTEDGEDGEDLPKEKEPDGRKFKQLLLNRCQEEFEQEAAKKRLQEAKDEIERKKKEGKLAPEAIEEEIDVEFKMKRRMIGNIQFIGELFKLQMLSEKIMHICVRQLLTKKDRDEEDLECLCRLLSTVGKLMDNEKSKASMNEYFKSLIEIKSKPEVSARLRFMIMDVIELRQSRWVPRRQEAKATTIDQVHAEAQAEQLKQQQQQAAMAQRGPPGRGPQGGGRGGYGGQQYGRDQRGQVTQPAARDGWSTVPSMSLNRSRMGGLGKPAATGDLVLKPGGAFGRTMGASSASGSGTNSPTPDDVRNRGNIFNALRSDEKKEREPERERSDSESSTRERPVQSPSPSRAAGQPEPAAGSPAPAAGGAPLSRDECEKKTASMLEEYFSVADVAEAVNCVQELRNPEYHSEVVVAAFNSSIEHKEIDRVRAAALFAGLFDAGVLTAEQYIDGLSSIAEFIDDLAYDVPQVYEFLGAFIGRAVADGHVTFAPIVPELAHLTHSGKALVVIAEALKVVAASKGEKAAKAAWDASGINIAEYVPEAKRGAVGEVLAERGIAFVAGGGSPSSAALDVEKELKALLARTASNKEVFEWINKNIPESERDTADFARTLVTSVASDIMSRLEGVADADGSALRQHIDARASLLAETIRDRMDMQLHALFAVQVVGHKNRTAKSGYPGPLVERWFSGLYENEVIEEDTYRNWRDDTRHASQFPGKDAAVKEVHKFFEWLESAED